MKIVTLDHIHEEGISHNPEIKKKVMLKAGDLPHLTNFSQTKLTPGQVADAHKHDKMYEVFLVEAGTGIIYIDNQKYQLEKGVCIAVEPGESHEIVNSGQSELIITYFGIKK